MEFHVPRGKLYGEAHELYKSFQTEIAQTGVDAYETSSTHFRSHR